jgi:hypothetical protein
MATYSASSPWHDTYQNNLYLEMWVPRPIPAAQDDYIYKIEPQYSFRPDLLAYDLYGNPKLWWVFMQRNADVIFDPIFDFKAGVTIQLPKKTPLLSYLGLGG